jgi:GNAT superfamily N-acetyltransferase
MVNMEQKRLKNISDPYFQDSWRLYEEAFPIEERRSLENQRVVMKKEIYHFDTLIEEEQMIGVLLWWDFKTYRYIDHFATSTQQRNKGFGKLILEKFRDLNDKPILLEVELPNSDINKRRIKFYERAGFKLNKHNYSTQSSQENQPPLELMLMSYPNQLTKKDVEQFTKINHPIIFQ